MIYFIITTSINNKLGIKNDEHRQNKYMDSIQNLLLLIENDTSIKPIIVENNGLRQTYLDNLKCDIVYTNNNVLNFSQGLLNCTSAQKQKGNIKSPPASILALNSGVKIL